MKNYILIAAMAISFIGCTKEHDHEYDHNHDYDHNHNQRPQMGTIKFAAFESNNAFSGSLELFPCADTTFEYVGNYYHNAVTAINPSCVVSKGGISAWGYPLLLPLGTYNMIYWGISSTASYSASRAMPAPLRLGTNMADAYWSMALSKDKKTYMPVWDQVMAVQSVRMGTSGISVNLNRMVAGVKVVIKNSNSTPFDPSIVSFEVLIGGIAEKINYTTGEPMNQSKTVRFALAIDPTRTVASNATAMLYPSAESPSIEIIVKLANGQSRTYNTNLKNAFQANTSQTVTILTGDILASDPAGSTFTVEGWNEESETISLPIIG